MANKKIYDLPRASSITGNEVLPLTTQADNTAADLNFISAWFNAKPTAYNFGALSYEPTVSPFDGGPIPLGAQYYNTDTNLLRVYGSSGWFTPNIDAQLLAEPDGATLVGTPDGTVQASLNGRVKTIDLSAAATVPMMAFSAAQAQSIFDNALPLTDYAELLAYPERAVGVRITGVYGTALPDGRAGIFQYNPSAPNTTDGGTQFAHASGVGAWQRDRSGGVVNAQWFGLSEMATGAANTSAMQAAIAASLFVFVPDPYSATASYNIAGSIQLRNDLTIYGQTMWRGLIGGSTGPFTFVGDGVNPIFVTGIYPGGSGLANRNIRIEGISARNTGARVIDILSANNFKIIRCAFISYGNADATRGTVNIRYSYRGEITGCWLGGSGGTWAVSAYDNVNVLNMQANIMSGGALGGVMDIGQSQNIRVNGSTIEQSLKGFRVAGASGIAGNGICNGVNLDDNYMEQVGSPYEIGTGFIVRGLSILRPFISNGSLTYPEDNYFRLGRVESWVIKDADITRDTGGTAEVFDFQYSVSAPFYAQNGEASGLRVTNGTGAFLKLTGFPSSAQLGYITGLNKIQPVLGGPTSGTRVFESQPLAANASVAYAVTAPAPYGGVVDSVEVFNASGAAATLACTVRLGSPSAPDEIQTFDPSTLTYTLNAADTGMVAPARLVRAAGSIRLEVVAGAGAGTFRLRIKYRAL